MPERSSQRSLTRFPAYLPGVPVELSDDIHRYRELLTQRRELDQALNDLAARTVKALRSVAGLTDEDSAAVLGGGPVWRALPADFPPAWTVCYWAASRGGIVIAERPGPMVLANDSRYG